MPWSSKRHRPHGQRTERERKAEFQRTRVDQDRQRFYRSPAWRALRLRKLAADPLCEACAERGRAVAASVVDHRVDVRDDDERKLDPTNLRSLCVSCHNAKTARSVNARRG